VVITKEKIMNMLTKSTNKTAVASGFMTISAEEARNALENWGKGLVKIAQAHLKGKNAKEVAKDVIKQAYNYNEAEVLFKPTLASAITFRKTFEGALSYFVGGDQKFAEDAGFALNPWKKADFEIAGIYTSGDTAMIMGNKHLMKEDGSIVKANFTMGFKKNIEGEVKIVLHHSSLPYQP
jgi:hypothetical protein